MTKSLPVCCAPSGWHGPHWDGVVYPKPRPRGFHELEFLSQYFDAIEVNCTFHTFPRLEIPHVWLRKVEQNPHFLFTVLLHQSFTHRRDLSAEHVAAFRRFLDVLKRAGRLGCVLMQFPWSFRLAGENCDFLIRLRRTFSDYPLVAELRHESWVREEALGILTDHGIGFCNLDQPQYMRAMPQTAVLTSPVGYFRFHGRSMSPDFQQFEVPRGTPPSAYLYSELELQEWRERILRIAAYAERVFITMTNGSAGRSVVNALQMQGLLGARSSRAPAPLLRYYGSLLPRHLADRPVQSEMFVWSGTPKRAHRNVA